MTPHGPLSGQTLGGKYLLGELLGRGGFGAVYQAENQLLHRPQAVKVLLEEHFSKSKFRERFLREARTLGMLDHPQIVHVDDLGIEGHLLYLVMPYISGGTLQDLLKARSGPLKLEEVTRALEQMCAALSYAHAQGVVHLDLKPMNILVHQDGRLLLSDFGLAHLLEQGAIEGGTSLHFGSPLYMAPEQFDGRPTQQSDIYALGVILYQLLTGRPPFEASTPAAIMRQHLMDPPSPLRARRPDLPAAMEDVLARALAKQPEQRYTHAEDILQSFRAALPERIRSLLPGSADGDSQSQTALASTVPGARRTGVPTASPGLVAQTRHCIHCGADTPLPMSFCGACGRPLGESPGYFSAAHPGRQVGLPGIAGSSTPPLSVQRKRADRLRSPVVLLLASVLALVLVGATVLVVLKPFSHTISPPTVAPGTITEFPVPTPGSEPDAITAGPDGNLWFLEPSANKIGRITPGGVITEFAVPSGVHLNHLSGGSSITAGPDGDLWFTLKLFSSSDLIGRITPSGAITIFPRPAGILSSCIGVTTGPDGNLWCTASGSIVQISPDGVAARFPLPFTAGTPGNITAGSDGNLWFTQGYSKGEIGRITPSGVLTEFPLPNSQSEPTDITAVRGGDLWFTDPRLKSSTIDQIGRITPAGSITEFPISQGSVPHGITTGPDGNLWFTEYSGDQIGRITPAGFITEFPISHNSDLEGIAAGPDGNLWFTEPGANQIGRIIPGK